MVTEEARKRKMLQWPNDLAFCIDILTLGFYIKADI